MRGRWRAAAAMVLAATVGAVGVVGCGPDEGAEPDDAVPTTAGTGDPARAPAAFATAGDGGWGLVGATDDHLVGLGGPAADDDRMGQVFDLATGEVRDVAPPAPVDDRPVQLDDAVFAAEAVVVAAYVYGPGFDPETDFPPDSGFTPPTEALTYWLDPATARWEPLALPDDLARRDRPVSPTLTAVDRRDALIVLDGSAVTPGRLLRTDGDRWVELARVDVVGDTSACATATDWWELDDTDLGGRNARMSAVSLADGTRRDVAGPERIRDDDWEVRTLACSADAVVVGLSSSLPTGAPPDDPGRLPATTFTSADGSTWAEPPEPEPFGAAQAFVGYADSGVGPGAVLHAGNMEEEGTTHPVLVGPTGATVALPFTQRHPPVYALRGSRPELIVLDPAAVEDDTVPVEVVAVPGT